MSAKSIHDNVLGECLSGGGGDGDAISARTPTELGKAVGANGDLVGDRGGFQRERDRLTEEWRKVEENGGVAIATKLHANLDQTGWAVASVCDDNFPSIFPKRLIFDQGNRQPLPVENAATDGDGDVEYAIPWNGHIPLVSRRTGEFLGWTHPAVSIHRFVPLWKTILRVLQAWFQVRFMRAR